MGKCSTCGNSGFLLKTYNCLVCRKQGCEKCLITGLRLFAHEEGYVHKTDILFCSQACYEKFTWGLIEQHLVDSLSNACINAVNELDPNIISKAQGSFKNPRFEVETAPDLVKYFNEKQNLRHAEIYEKAGRLNKRRICMSFLGCMRKLGDLETKTDKSL
ncbi:hypothetical protein MUP01_04415 [Candidatus Bathyarchaeota archaeon]|nr:hypothetical protein [Candidatus Bathyarchaeota archaeon]